MKAWDGKERRSQNIEFEHLKGQLELLDQKVDNLHSAKDRAHQSVLEIIRKQNETLYGNGRPGLTTMVAGLGESVKSMDKNIAIHSKIDGWIHATILTIVLFMLGKMIISG